MKKIIVFLAVGLFIIVNCKHIPYAREVKKKSEGGVIALKIGYYPEDRALAEDYMKKNCGSKEVKILEEGEVVVGQKTQASSDTSHSTAPASNFGSMGFGNQPRENTQTSSTTMNVSEWQIQYQCVEPVPVAAPAEPQKTEKVEKKGKKK